jgi:hypothetical protein
MALATRAVVADAPRNWTISEFGFPGSWIKYELDKELGTVQSETKPCSIACLVNSAVVRNPSFLLMFSR